MDELPKPLRVNATDKVVMGVTAASGLLDVLGPGVGTFFGVLLSRVIPGQRQERLIQYVARLGTRCRNIQDALAAHTDRIEALEGVAEKLVRDLSEDQIALFEDGAIVAIKSRTKERIDSIADAVANGINDRANTSNAALIISIFENVTDEEISILCYYWRGFDKSQEWLDSNWKIIDPKRAIRGGSPEPITKDELQRLANIRDYRIFRLTSLGLLQDNSKSVVRDLTGIASKSNGRIPDRIEVDVERGRPTLTSLGRMLLEHLFPEATPENSLEGLYE